MTYEIAIIGGGSGGFSAAIRLAEAGKKVVVIEKGTIGGTCVNVGCIPSKFIIYESTINNDWEKIKIKRDLLVTELREKKYVKVLNSYSNITYVNSTASFINEKTIILDNGETLKADYFIVATGSKPKIPNIKGINNIKPLDSTGLLFIEKLPKSLTIIGGRYIALELAQSYSRMGVKVTVIQRSKHLIPQYDCCVSAVIEKRFKDDDIKLFTNTQITKAEISNKGKKITFINENKEISIISEEVLVATGRVGNIDLLDLGNAGVEIDSDKKIVVNDYLKTSNKRIYAIGDVVNSPALVYVASKEGQIAADNIIDNNSIKISHNALPEVIFTTPQIAKTGLTESGLIEQNIPFVSTQFYIKDTPYGYVNNIENGIIKIFKNSENNKIMGAEIVSIDAGNMIQSITIAIKGKLTEKDLIDTYYPYLTAIEGFKLGLLTFTKDVNKLSCCAV